MTAYKRLTLYERQKIEEGLDARLGFRELARLLERDPSTISQEVKSNRYRKNRKQFGRKFGCREKKECRIQKICPT